jgi:hypothetical protein
MDRLGQRRRRRVEFGRRKSGPSLRSRRQRIGVAMILAAPLAGVLAALAAFYADSGVLGILVAAISFAGLSGLMLDPVGRAAG